MGRPTKLTAAIQRKIVKLIKEGVAPTRAAVCAGIHRDTYHDWMKRGREEEAGIYSDFLDAIEKARAAIAAEAEKAVRKAFTGVKEKTTRKKLERRESDGRLVVVEEVRTTTEKVYPQFAVVWLERQERTDWAPAKAKEEMEAPPDRVTAGPDYDDPWLEGDESRSPDNANEDDP